MNLYTYLENNMPGKYPWENYTFEEAEIPSLKENVGLLCATWDAINEWATEYADDCKGVDAALIARVLNETITMINRLTANAPISISDVADLCSVYGRCCIFAKHIMAGTEYFLQCQFVVNNTIANSIISRKKPNVDLMKIKSSSPQKGLWEEL